ncbi:hypothetical protein FDP41_011851 [Naegleria fowleri]|uniref:RNB domain-containing protein n=1 Tax=Naegleria fowleri TaxID=5763 RepID=A0A6A5C865_NAEFO|nr:uncharacterized protein FDP41_011851 [Naegleria fowleri]KAF0981990.1 hypothetical protein FDP41_011851 [Naegleria fowleri]
MSFPSNSDTHHHEDVGGTSSNQFYEASSIMVPHSSSSSSNMGGATRPPKKSAPKQPHHGRSSSKGGTTGGNEDATSNNNTNKNEKSKGPGNGQSQTSKPHHKPPPSRKQVAQVKFVKIQSSSAHIGTESSETHPTTVPDEVARTSVVATSSTITASSTAQDAPTSSHHHHEPSIESYIPMYVRKIREILETVYGGSIDVKAITKTIWDDIIQPTIISELNPSLHVMLSVQNMNNIASYLKSDDPRLVQVVMSIDQLLTDVHHADYVEDYIPTVYLDKHKIVRVKNQPVLLLPTLETTLFDLIEHEIRKAWRKANEYTNSQLLNVTSQLETIQKLYYEQAPKQIDELLIELNNIKHMDEECIQKRTKIHEELDNMSSKIKSLTEAIISLRTQQMAQIEPSVEESKETPVTEEQVPEEYLSAEELQELDQKRKQLIATVDAFLALIESDREEETNKLQLFSDAVHLLHASLYNTQKNLGLAQVVPLPARTIPVSIITKLINFLKDNTEKIPHSVVSCLLQVSALSLKGRKVNEKKEIFAVYHSALMHFTQYLTIRKMELFLKIMYQVVQSLHHTDPEFVNLMLHELPKTGSKTHANFSDRTKLVQLWQVQAFCATLVMPNPILSHQIFSFYTRHVLTWINLWEDIRNLCLRETSLTQIKKGSFKTSTTPTTSPTTLAVPEANDGYASSSEKESEVETGTERLEEVTKEIQSQLEVDQTVHADIENIEKELLKSPEKLKKEAELMNMMQLTNDCVHLYETELKPSEEEKLAKKELVEEVSKIISTLFSQNQNTAELNEPKIYTYGSYASDLSLKGASDIDMCVSFEGLENIQENNKLQGRILEMIRKEMDGKSKNDSTLFPHLKSQNQEVVRSSRVPILKIHDSKRNLDCDLCVATYMGVVNTRMISTYLMVDPKMLTHYGATNDTYMLDRVKMLIYIIKRWAKRRHINDPPAGSLSSYSYVLLTLQFLQTIEVLPSLQQLAEDDNVSIEDISKPHTINAYNTKYFKNLEKLPSLWKAMDVEKVSKYTLGHLVYMFFEFYAKKFNFDTHSVSLRNGSPIPKKKVSPNSQIIISIEDPFEIRDLGSVVSNEMGPVIVSEFRRTFEILSSGGSIHDVLEEREGISSVNIYQMKRDFGKGYDEHLQLEQVAEMINKGELFQGELRVNKKRMTEAYVTVEGGPFKKDIFIDGLKNRNRAMHGDIVAVKVEKTKIVAGSVMETVENKESTNEDKVEPISSTAAVEVTEENVIFTGVVVAVLKKKSPSIFPCTLMAQDEIRGYRWLIPLEKSYPKLMVKFEEFKKKFNAKSHVIEEGIFVVEMKPWDKGSNYPKGSLIGCLGFKKDLWSLKRALLLQYCPIMFDNVYSERKVDREAEKEIVSTGSSAILSQSVKMADSVAGSLVSQSVLEENSETLKNRQDMNNSISNIGDTISDINFDRGSSSDNLIQVQDWRQSRRIFTIDPTHSKDLDDAIAIEPIYEQNIPKITDLNRKSYENVQKFLVTVAIADVSQFVPLNSPIDKEARKRGTSVYMINSVEHMLDPSLSQNLCSLHGGVNRFAIAVEFIIDRETCEIDKESIKFNRCMMRSCCRLDYNRAQKMILHYNKNKFNGFVGSDPKVKFGLEVDEVPATYGTFTLDEIYEDIQIFNELSQKLRQQRAEKGSVFLKNEQLNFECDMNGKGFPLKVLCDEHNESHILIEEMMLVANELAAIALYEHFGDATLLRVHSSPKIDKWAVTVAMLADRICRWKIENVVKQGIETEAENEKAIVLDLLEKCIRQRTKGLEENEKPVTIQYVINLLIENAKEHETLMHTIQHMLLREMQLAQYATVGDCKKSKSSDDEEQDLSHSDFTKRLIPKKKFENTWHFALCKEFYTHFTSPIRRYADLIVHRCLLQMIKENRLKELGVSKEEILASREASLSAHELSSIAEHLNDQAYRARLLQDECEKQYLAYYLLPILSASVERVEAVVLSLGKRSFTIYVPKYGLELQVNAMKHFSPTPTTINLEEKEIESIVPRKVLSIASENADEEGHLGGSFIEKLTITWSVSSTNPTASVVDLDEDQTKQTITTTTSLEQPSSDKVSTAWSPYKRTIELVPLKKILVDLDVNLGQVPIEIMCYNIWEFGQELKNPTFSPKLIQKHSKTAASQNAFKENTKLNEKTSAVLQSVSAQVKQMENIIETMQKKSRKKSVPSSSPATSSSSTASQQQPQQPHVPPTTRPHFPPGSRGRGKGREGTVLGESGSSTHHHNPHHTHQGHLHNAHHHSERGGFSSRGRGVRVKRLPHNEE